MTTKTYTVCPCCGTNAPTYHADEGTAGFIPGYDCAAEEARIEELEAACERALYIINAATALNDCLGTKAILIQALGKEEK